MTPLSLGLTGCGFFPKLPPACTTDCTTSSNFMYAANSVSSAPSIAGFSLTTTAATSTTPASLNLAVTSGSAYSLPVVPSAIAINPKNNAFMYVAAQAGGIYLYSIGSNGALTLQNNSTAVASGIVSSMQVDWSGAWLIVTNASIGTTNAQISVYSIASTTGILTQAGNPLTVSKPGASQKMAIAPNNTNVFVNLGTGGTEALTFNASTGALADVGNLPTRGNSFNDTAVTTDPNSTYAFIAEVGSGVRVLSIQTNGGLSEITGSPFGAGTGPSAVLVDSTGSYVYVTDQTNSKIYEYTLTAKTGTLTAVANSPINTGSTPVGMVEDSTNTYIGVVCNGGNQDLEVYSFDSTTLGQLDSAGNATTGTDPTSPIAIAATHGT